MSAMVTSQELAWCSQNTPQNPHGLVETWGIQGGDAQRLLGVSDGNHPNQRKRWKKRGLGSSGQTKLKAQIRFS